MYSAAEMDMTRGNGGEEARREASVSSGASLDKGHRTGQTDGGGWWRKRGRLWVVGSVAILVVLALALGLGLGLGLDKGHQAGSVAASSASSASSAGSALTPSPTTSLSLGAATTLASTTTSLASSSAVPSATLNAYAKVLSNALLATSSPSAFPEYTDPDGSWHTFPATEWTAGFFAGSLWLLNERKTLCPLLAQAIQSASSATTLPDLVALARTWQTPLTVDETRTDTHDLGFLILPTFATDYAQTGDETARQAVITAGNALATRFSAIVGCLRSWENLDPATNFEVIIDNMMNIDLLYQAASLTSNTTLSDIATTHARTTMRNHVRADGSSFHVVDYSPQSGQVLAKYTAQGYSNTSTWSRGQSWGIYGFAMAYNRTGEMDFLSTSLAMAEYYVGHLPSGGLPYWDFDAPQPTTLDSSSAAIAAAAFLTLGAMANAPAPTNTSLGSTWRAVGQGLLDRLNANTLGPTISLAQAVAPTTTTTPFAAILDAGTVNNRASPPNNSTGIVYGDYYYLQAGNILARQYGVC